MASPERLHRRYRLGAGGPHGGGAAAALVIVTLLLGGGATASPGHPARGGVLSASAATLYVGILGPKEVTLGGVASFQANVTGGVPPYEYLWAFSGNASRTSTDRNFSVRPYSDGLFEVNLTVRDSNSQNSSAVRTFSTTGPDPLSVQISVSGVGSAVVFIAHVVGGTPPFGYLWSGPGAPSGWSTSANWTAREIPSGTSRVGVEVRDVYNYTASTLLNVVNSASPPAPWYNGLFEPLAAVLAGFAIALGIVYLVARHRRRKRSPPSSAPP